MRSISQIMSSLPLAVKSLVITVMTLVFSHVVVYDLMSVSFFSPMEKASDFRFSDFYTIVADDRAVATLDSNIVIVPVDGRTRKDIARIIDDIDFCGPSAVGLDIAFAPPSNPDDDPLAGSLAGCSNLVMPIRVAYDGDSLHSEHLSYYDALVNPDGGFAAVNIQGDLKERSTVRYFSKQFATVEDTVPCFAAALVAIARPEAAKKLFDRDDDEEFIQFASRRFDIVEPDEIIDYKDLLKDKIVIVGKMKNSGDLHVTPLDNFTPGILVHAYTAATILEGEFIRDTSSFESYATAALACLLIVWLNMLLITHPVGPLVVRVVQIILLYLMIVGGTIAYINYNIDLNFSFAIMSTTLGVAACDVYIGLFSKGGLCDIIAKIFRKRND